MRQLVTHGKEGGRLGLSSHQADERWDGRQTMFDYQ